MITEKDLQAAIAECKGTRNPTASTCIRLAAYYTILQNMYGIEEPSPHYSMASKGAQIDSENELLMQLQGKDETAVWRLIEDFIDTVAVVEPRLYNAMLKKAKEIPY